MRYATSCSTCGAQYAIAGREETKGEAFTRICPACRQKQREFLGLTSKNMRMPSRFPAEWTFDDCIIRAEELGMSYGNFMVAVNVNGMNPGSRPGGRSLRKQRKGR